MDSEGVEFQLNDAEIGHLHDNCLFDLLLPKSERDRWIKEGKARPHPIYPDSGWVSKWKGEIKND
ncbi:luciferase family protein [Paenibacillus sp. TAB 01]|uniref:luciferase domain-containing protein n=1 Tax=Paenibacillus sp. TAB 01 TaxID=3368988 RepID=UPI003753B412